MHHFNVEGADYAMMKITSGLAVKQAMKEKNHGLGRLPVAPVQPKLALQHVLGYVNELVVMAASRAIPGRGVADGGGGGGGGGGELRLDAVSRAALERFGAMAAAWSAAAHSTDKIILGKAPDERGMHRLEHFSRINVGPFERHETAIVRLSALSGKAFKDGFFALVVVCPDGCVLGRQAHGNKTW